MDRQSNAYTFTFALAVCIVCSLALSTVYEGLKEKRKLNIEMDIKKNILKAVDLKQPLTDDATPQEVLEVYGAAIEEKVIDAQGNIVEGKGPQDIQDGDEQYGMYVYKDQGRVIAYCFPIIGKGLWSTLYGYFALEPDAITVRGITFYKHGETPGLGAEIEQDWFQNNYKGKKIWDIKKSMLTPTVVVKGKVTDSKSAEEAQYYVDGISGATMTSKGVTEMVDRWLNIYEPFFKKIRKQ